MVLQSTEICSSENENGQGKLKNYYFFTTLFRLPTFAHPKNFE